MRTKPLIKWLLLPLIFQVSVLAASEKLETDVIIATIKQAFPDLEVTSVRPSQVGGLYEVMLGPEVVYMSGDGRYLFQGNLLDLKHRKNLSEEQRSIARVQLLKNIPKNEIIEFSTKNTKHNVYVFTDITCGYCRRLHQDVPELNKRGIAVSYLAFPRNGAGSQTFKDMVSVWCATDRQKAMTDAKRGKKIIAKECDNPISRHFALGQLMGIQGTPAIFLENGHDLPGYLPPDELARVLLR